MTTVGLLAYLREGFEHLDFRKLMGYAELISKGLDGLGTTFAYRHGNLFLTAAHAVKGLDLGRLRILHGDAPTEVVRFVRSVSFHPEADIAALHLVPDSFSQFVRPSPGNLFKVEVGTDVVAFGYPEDAFSAAPGEPTRSVPRLFKGHVQRLMRHESIHGYTYDAAELNFPCPTGLSGGPVYPRDHPTLLGGLATSSLRSSTYVDAIVKEGGSEASTEFYRVVEYGVCLLLNEVDNWLSLEYGAAAST